MSEWEFPDYAGHTKTEPHLNFGVTVYHIKWRSGTLRARLYCRDSLIEDKIELLDCTLMFLSDCCLGDPLGLKTGTVCKTCEQPFANGGSLEWGYLSDGRCIPVGFNYGEMSTWALSSGLLSPYEAVMQENELGFFIQGFLDR